MYWNNIKKIFFIGVTLLIFLLLTVAQAENKVGITVDVMEVMVKHQGKTIIIKRNQDSSAILEGDFALTSRPCPPFCVQPAKVAAGVETIAEVEVLQYLKKMSAGDDHILVVDSRTKDWVKRGSIPGAINIPWNQLNPKEGATTEAIVKIMVDNFAVKLAKKIEIIDVDDAIANADTSKVFDFKQAKTLVLFCNGMWCGQSPTSIKTLLKFGYPPEKLKYFRGGMQTWAILGLTTTATQIED